MVSFSCEACNETVAKRKCPQHQRQCRGAVFTCLDCNCTFPGNTYMQHTSCVSEAEKYEKGLYQGKKKNGKSAKNSKNGVQKPQREEKNLQESVKEPKIAEKVVKDAKESKDSKPAKTAKTAKTAKNSKKHQLKDFVSEPSDLYKVYKKWHKTGKHGDKGEFLKALEVTVGADGSSVEISFRD